jgi:hypothetical protein
MIGIAIGAVLVSCLLASMYETKSDGDRDYKKIEKKQGLIGTPGGSILVLDKKIQASDLEKIALSELPERLDEKPAGVLGELYVKKEVYIRKDLAEK